MPVAGQQVPVAFAQPLPSPLPALSGTTDLLDDELLDTLPALDSSSMLLDQEPISGAKLTSQKPCTPPVNAPSSPEQVTGSQLQHAGLAAYNADELQRKRAARLARNRQSAQELRNRKRQYAERVEQENEALKSHTSQLQAHISSLTAENKLLRQENDFYRGMLASRTTTKNVSTAQTSSTPKKPTQVPVSSQRSKSARGVGVLASLLAMIGMTLNQEQAPSKMAASGMGLGDALPVSSRRALDAVDASDPDETLALPDKDLLRRRETGAATAVASDVGLVVRDAAVPLIPATDATEASSVATLQLGTRRFILAAADSAVRWVATPLGGSDSVPYADLEGSDAVGAVVSGAPNAAEQQDDYILGGPTRKATVALGQQQDAASKDTAVALCWTEQDTTEFLVRMLAGMDTNEKQQVINMLVHEYGADVFGGLFERALMTDADAGALSGTNDLSESLVKSSAAEDARLKDLPCECIQAMDEDESPRRSVVPVTGTGLSQSTAYVSG